MRKIDWSILWVVGVMSLFIYVFSVLGVGDMTENAKRIERECKVPDRPNSYYEALDEYATND